MSVSEKIKSRQSSATSNTKTPTREGKTIPKKLKKKDSALFASEGTTGPSTEKRIVDIAIEFLNSRIMNALDLSVLNDSNEEEETEDQVTEGENDIKDHQQ